MRTITFVQIAAVAFAIAMLINSASQTPPAHHDLSRVEGVAGHTTVYPARRKSREYANIQVLISEREHQIVKTYDMELARSIVAGAPLVARVHQASKELWSIEQAGRITRTYEQTLAVRGPEIAQTAQRLKLFAVYGLFFAAAMLLVRVWRGREAIQ